MFAMQIAPKDGTRIIIWDAADGLPHCAHWSDDYDTWFMFHDAVDGEAFEITHPTIGWIPMPEMKGSAD